METELSISDIIYSFFFKDSNEIELQIEFDVEDYGALKIGKARNFFTSDEGFVRLRNFLNETKNCETIAEFFDKVLAYYKISEDNFRSTLELAAAATAQVFCKDNASDKYKDLNYIIKILYPNLDKNSAQYLIGKDILKEVGGSFDCTEETIQQQLFRKNPKIYIGDIEKQRQCNSWRAHRNQIKIVGWVRPQVSINSYFPGLAFADANQ